MKNDNECKKYGMKFTIEIILDYKKWSQMKNI